MERKKTSKFWEYAKAIALALILALFIRAYFVQAFKIPSGSMIPTLLIGDHLLVNKFIYGTKIPFSNNRVLVLKKPERGDIIVFRFPHEPDRDFIKRIIAVEGDVIEGRNKEIYLNGKKISEPYIQHTDIYVIMGSRDPRDNFPAQTVPNDMYFVMGDNRDQSFDSRYWGFVNAKDIRGKAFILYWSWDDTKKLPRFGRIGNLIY